MINNRWFTFVELVIVISILALLFSIWFVWFTWYLVWTRDANRLSQITSLNDGIRLYWNQNQLPLPEDYIQITLSWTTIAYQWYIWKKILSLIDFQEWWKDPKDKTYFTYYLTKNRKYFQILGFLEDQSSAINEASVDLIDKTYARVIDYTNRYIMVYGDKLWVLTQANTNKPIQEVENISSIGYLDIWTTIDYYTSTLLNNDWIIWTWAILWKLWEVANFWWKGCTTKTWIISCTWEAGWWTLVWAGWGWTWTGWGWVIEDFTIEQYNWWRRWTDWNLASSCNKYKTPEVGYSYTWDIWNWNYWIEPVIWTSINVYCDMTIDNWGWTLVFNRKADNNNEESCWTNLNEFLQNTCWDSNLIWKDDSYSIWRTNRLLLSNTEYLVVQYLNWVLDIDDSYIIRYSWDLFPNSIWQMNNIIVDRVCDINSSNCDTTDVSWKYVWDGYYSNSWCDSIYSNDILSYKWNYWVCNNWIVTNYYSSTFIWNRDQYNETKLWWNINYLSKNYQERIFIR